MMLEKTLKVAVALPLAAITVAASGGLTIFLHHCSCKGKTEISIYGRSGCAAHPGSKARHSCCNGRSAATPSGQFGCCGCSTEQIAVALADTALAAPVTVGLAKLLPLAAGLDAQARQPLTPQGPTGSYVETDASPPIPRGKALLISLSSLKISGTHS